MPAGCATEIPSHCCGNGTRTPRTPATWTDATRRTTREDFAAKHYARWRSTGTTEPSRPPVCSVVGCNQPHHAMTYCGLHYRRWQRHGSTDKPSRKRERPACSVAGCGASAHAGGMCRHHYDLARRTGKTDRTCPRCGRPFDPRGSGVRDCGCAPSDAAGESAAICSPFCGIPRLIRPTECGTILRKLAETM